MPLLFSSLLASCGGDAATGAGGPVAVQQLELLTVLPSVVGPGEEWELTIRARSPLGAFVSGAEIRGTVAAGGGTLIEIQDDQDYEEGSVATRGPDFVVTNGSGLAYFRWRMGVTGGEQRVEFRPGTGAGWVAASTVASPQQSALGVGFGPEQFTTIPAGSYSRGSTSGLSDEQPVRTVTISRAFQLQRTEVTQQQWRAVMGTNPSGFSGCDLCPVEQVSWLDVQEFITRLNQQTGLSYRLPTEAEWEYAARAGTTGETYGPLDQVAWYSANSSNRTRPVATKQPNAWGLYDILGNVWEWVNDWYNGDYYATGPAVDPLGPSTGAFRVLRGGSWLNTSTLVRAANRVNYTPSNRNYVSGFRLARTP